MHPLYVLVLAAGTVSGLGLNTGHWDYAHPEKWPGVCTSGESQSPVDLGPANAQAGILDGLQVRYPNRERRWQFDNNGHTLQLSLLDGRLPDEDYTISGAGLPGTYRLAQVHFHWGSGGGFGSEHTINGMSYPVEAHLVNVRAPYNSTVQALAANDSAAIAVVAVFFEVGAEPNPALLKVFSNPAVANASAGPSSTPTTTRIPLHHLLPRVGGLYRYNGSLTTPDCNEAVVWSVFKQPITLSPNQLAAFRSILGAEGQPISGNARPSQPINNREIVFDPTATVRMHRRSPITLFGLSEGHGVHAQHLTAAGGV